MPELRQAQSLNFYRSIVIITVACSSCQPPQPENKEISKSEMLNIVKNCDLQFSKGVKQKDSTILVDIYSDSAQYVQPNKPILTGKSEIGADWAEFLRLKENPIDLVLTIKNVEGTSEIIYETGSGYTLLADSTKWKFNYVNVWRHQEDGSYKLEIDAYN